MQADSLKDWPILHNVTDTSIFSKVFVLGNRALILLNDGTIGGIGSNEHYLMNEGSETSHFNNLTKISTTTKFKDFTTNGNHALAISKEGFLYSWGTNEHGQLGRNGPGSSVLLVSKMFAVRIKEAACGTGFSCVLTEDGRVFEWGIYGFNEFVLESHNELDKPNEAKENEEIVSIHATKHYVMILTKSGKVFLPSYKRLTNKCNLNVHIEKIYAFGGHMKKKMIKNIMTGKNYVFALTCNGEIFHWPAYSCNCNWEPDPERVAENFGRFRKIWAAASDDVIVAEDSFGNHYSITWNALEILPSMSKINFSSPGKYFSNLQMLLQGPVYDKRNVDVVIKENDAVLDEWRRKFDAAFNNQEGSDISFIVDEKTIYAHRAILSIQSTYLNAILRNEWKENTADKQVIIKEYSYPTYLRFMRFLYTGKLDPSSHEDTLELFKLAHEYMEKPLFDLCKNVISEGLTAENALSTYDVAVALGLEDLSEASKSFIGRNIKDVILTEDSSNVDKDILLRCVRDMVCSKNVV